MIRGTTLAAEQIRKDYDNSHANLSHTGRAEIGVLLAEIDALRVDLNTAQTTARMLTLPVLRACGNCAWCSSSPWDGCTRSRPGPGGFPKIDRNGPPPEWCPLRDGEK